MKTPLSTTKPDESEQEYFQAVMAELREQIARRTAHYSKLRVPKVKKYRSQAREIHSHVWAGRFARRMTQDELARRLGVQRKTIHSIETGKSVPSVALALKLARELDRSVDSLFTLR